MPVVTPGLRRLMPLRFMPVSARKGSDDGGSIWPDVGWIVTGVSFRIGHDNVCGGALSLKDCAKHS